MVNKYFEYRLSKKKYLIFALVLFINTLAYNTFSQPQLSATDYQKRLLGNEAFDSSLYDVAMNYYKRYLKDSIGDTPANRDAYFCLIATCLRAENIKEANNLINELESKYQSTFDKNPEEKRKLDFWQAEILLSEEKFADAEKIFTEILNDKDFSFDEITSSSYIGLGISQIRQKHWTEAKKTFTELNKLAKDDTTREIVNQQLVLINISLGKIDEAKKIIKDNPINKKENKEYLTLLEIYTLIADKKLEEAQKEYNSLRKVVAHPDTLWYIVSLSFAQAYIDNEDYTTALPLLEDACVLAPELFDKQQAMLIQINTQIKAGENKSAAEDAEIFLKNYPNSDEKEDILLTLITLLSKDEKYEKAISIATEYFSEDPIPSTKKLQIATVLGGIYLKTEDYKNAEEAFNYVVKNSLTEQEEGEGKYWLAEAELLQKKYTEAIESFTTLANAYPSWKEESKYKLALIYMQMKDYKKSADSFKSLIEKYPESKLQPSPKFLYANVLQELGENKEAIEHYLSFAKKQPENENAAKAYFESGCLSLKNNDFESAIEYFSIIRERYKDSPQLPDTLYNLSYAYYLNRDTENYIKSTQDLVNEFPETDYSIQSLFFLADFYMNKENDYEKAMQELSVLQEKYTDNPLILSKVLYEKAYLANKDGDNKAALNYLEQLTTDYPDSTSLGECFYLKGDILSEEGDYDKAIQYYLDASTSAEKANNFGLKIASWGRLADSYFATLNYTDDQSLALNSAIKYYEKILDEKNISDFIKVQTLYKIGKCYELAKNNEKAINYYHEAVFGSILYAKEGRNPSIEWFTKAGIALAKILQHENTASGAEKAINVYNILIKYNIQPVEDFKLRINELSKKYNLEDF